MTYCQVTQVPYEEHSYDFTMRHWKQVTESSRGAESRSGSGETEKGTLNNQTTIITSTGICDYELGVHRKEEGIIY